MKRIKKIISSKEIGGIADYINLCKEIEEYIKNNELKNYKAIKIAVLSSFTLKGVKEALFIKCCGIGVLAKFYISEYNQYSQDILNPDSGLYKFEPDLIIIFIDIMSILGEQYLMPYWISDAERKRLSDKKLGEIRLLTEKIKERSSAKILLHNFEVPLFSPLGISENRQKFGFIESVEALNAGLRAAFKDTAQALVFDYDSFCSKLGKQNIMDYKLYYLSDMKIDLQNVPKLCEEYLGYIKPLMSLNKKCIVLDLDNTLWGGIVGEDGLEGIKLGPTPEGRPFLEFQKYLLSLFQRGIILAVNSNNNIDDALKVFREHPYMALKEEHFAAMQINWNDKISNMKAIAEEINIGIDSMVFIDDDKLNREMIRKALPESLVVELPEDSSLYLKTLMEMNDFNTLHITEEDKKKGSMYAEQRKRKEFHKNALDINKYLKGLEMIATIERANPLTIPRISQLTQKTNQFNMTTRRYPEEDIQKFSKNDKFLVVSIKVEDKFGDNGITGAAIVEKNIAAWRIGTFLLSCRVIGRKIEEALLAYIIKLAKKEKAKELIGEFIPSKKNIPAKDFYKNNGFKLANKEDDKETWVYDTDKEYPSPSFIKVMIKEDKL